MIEKFTIRVYGILTDENKRVLLSDEFIRGDYFTKFPGGGMELGEGTRDCLKREFKEETGLDVTIGDHIYTTDFFQLSAFNPSHQILSIYYFAQALEPIHYPIRTSFFDFDSNQLEVYERTGETETFRFIDWDELTPDSVTLPIDKIVVQIMLKDYSKRFVKG